jgi:plastocyanin
MRTRAWLAVAALVLCTGAAQSQPKPKVHTVTIAEMRFTPRTLSVARGDLVVWVNKDIVPHTATSEEGGFDSKTIESNASWTLRVRTAGKFDYVCTLHPTMRAVLQVK